MAEASRIMRFALHMIILVTGASTAYAPGDLPMAHFANAVDADCVTTYDGNNTLWEQALVSKWDSISSMGDKALYMLRTPSASNQTFRDSLEAEFEFSLGQFILPDIYFFYATKQQASALHGRMAALNIKAVAAVPDLMKVRKDLKSEIATMTQQPDNVTREVLIELSPGSIGSVGGTGGAEELASVWEGAVRGGVTGSTASFTAQNANAISLKGVKGKEMSATLGIVSNQPQAMVMELVPLNVVPPDPEPNNGSTDINVSDTSGNSSRRLNNNAHGITQSGTPGQEPFFTAGLNGLGEVVGIADSGLDDRSCFFSGPLGAVIRDSEADDARRKVVQYVAFADGIAGERADHGTHVAGTVAGKSTVTPAGTVYDGMAPEAKIAFFDIGRAGQPFLDVPRSLYRDLFPPAKEAGAAIHTNSWGATVNRYTMNARDIDQYSYENEEFVVLVAAGNDGRRGRGSLGSPATAKNCISVGASVNTGTGNIEDVASFSSQGPASDGRIKPDVLAPGHAVLSANSATDPNAQTCSVTRQSGTSMATPAAAGTLALVRQYFREGFYPSGQKTTADGFVPSGALLKAVMVHSGQKMKGQVYGDTYPGNVQGFGRITLDKVLKLGASQVGPPGLFVLGSKIGQTRVALAEGDSFSQTFTTTAAGEFKATLVWMDPPAATNAKKHLVNDLDLLVTVIGATPQYPNGDSKADRVNNVEMVRIPNATIGQYTVSVTLHSLRAGRSQPYALVVTGHFSPPSAGGSETPTSPGAPPVSGASYQKLTVGGTPTKCSGGGLSPIRDAATCEAAAADLGLADTTATEISSGNKPDGCYFLQSRLYLATNRANRGNGIVGDREPICRTGAAELYRKLSTGDCRAAGLVPITSSVLCQAAAAELGLGDTTVSVTDATQRPEGCYYRSVLPGNALWLSTNSQNQGGGAADGREPICLALDAFPRSVGTTLTTTTTATTATAFQLGSTFERILQVDPNATTATTTTGAPSPPATTTRKPNAAVVSAAVRLHGASGGALLSAAVAALSMAKGS